MALAKKIVNWEGGSDARYDISGLERLPDGTYTDGTYRYDSNGLDLSGRSANDKEWTPGLPGARGGNGPGGGGGGGASSNALGGVGAGISDPWFNQLKSLFMGQSASENAARKEAIQKALINFGIVPEGFQDKYGDLDPMTRELAEKNTTSGISAYARMIQNRSDNQRNLLRRLTARGLRRSGAKGYGLRRNQLDFDKNFSDSTNQLLNYTQGVYGGFANSEYQRMLALLQALQNVNFAGSGDTSGSGNPFIPTSKSAGPGNTSHVPVPIPETSSDWLKLGRPVPPTTAYPPPTGNKFGIS